VFLFQANKKSAPLIENLRPEYERQEIRMASCLRVLNRGFEKENNLGN